MRRRLSPIALLIVLTLVPLGAPAATKSLDTEWCLPVDDAYRLVGASLSACPSAAVPLEFTQDFGAGEARFLVGRLEASSTTDLSVLQVALVNCGTDAGVTTSINNLGRDEAPTLTPVRYLFVSAAARTATCALLGRARNISGARDPHLPVRAGRTYIELSDDAKPGAARWGTPEIQIGAGTAAGSEGEVLVTTWAADPQAAAVDMMADLEVTTCNAPSSSCNLFGQTGSGDVASGSVVGTRLEVVQLDASGAPCRTTQWPGVGEMRTTISNRARHLKLFHGAVFPLAGECAPSFAVKVRVRLVSGNVATVEGGRFSTGIAMNVPSSAAPDTVPPGPPQPLTAAPGDRRAVLDWADVLEADLASYVVERTTDPPAGTRTWTPVAAVSLNVSAHTDRGLTNGQTYFYRVLAQDRTGNAGLPSNEAAVTPRRVCPGFEGDSRNQIVGTSAAETLTGTGGADILCGLGGDDTLRGLGGNDVILGGSGDDRIDAGDGNDRADGGDGADVVYGVGGDDVLSGGPGDDVLSGGAGADRFAGGDGADRILGGTGDDLAYGQGGNDRVFGNAGADRISAGDGDDAVDGGPDADRIWGGRGADALFGSAGDDVLDGGSGPDRATGGPGDDVLVGGAGDDVLSGGEGSDRHYGQAGDDRILAADGEGDLVSGGDGEDDRASVDGADRVSGVERVFR